MLDRLLFYLRVVHSVDFYNHSEYPNEDEMPNRSGEETGGTDDGCRPTYLPFWACRLAVSGCFRKKLSRLVI